MKGLKAAVFLFLLGASPSLFGDQLVNKLSQSRTNLLIGVASVWVELAAATQAALSYGLAYQQEVPQFCCGNCGKIVNYFEFIEKMLVTITGDTMGLVLASYNIYNFEITLEDAVPLKDRFAKMKQLFLAGNAESILVFMMDACQKKEIIRFRCSECYANDWQCDTSGISNYANTTGSLLATYKKSP